MNTVFAMGIGFALDCLLGDPHHLPHPVRWIGRLIGFLDRQLHLKKSSSARRQLAAGILLVVLVTAVTGGAVMLIRLFTYRLSITFGIAADGILFYYCIAPRSLYTESMAVYDALEKDSLTGARQRLSMIVGRDTECLTEEGIIKAAIETVAENTSDGVTAPVIYMAIGGPVLCFLYKAVNTMDSMVGYHSEIYEYFGKAAARVDDVWNYIPSRLTALVMLLLAIPLQLLSRFSENCKNSNNNHKKNCAKNSLNSRDFTNKYQTNLYFPPVISNKSIDWKRGWKIYRRDRHCHKSPNSGQTESVCAGILGVRLAGDASYFGKTVHKPHIGDPVRTAEREDIRRANLMMYAAAIVVLLLAAALRMLYDCY